jgi:hypothetical protein
VQLNLKPRAYLIGSALALICVARTAVAGIAEDNVRLSATPSAQSLASTGCEDMMKSPIEYKAGSFSIDPARFALAVAANAAASRSTWPPREPMPAASRACEPPLAGG